LGADAVFQADAARDLLHVGREECVGGVLIISAVRRSVNISGAWFSESGP
jgi:hypothetical protein